MGIFKKNISGYEWQKMLVRIERLEEKAFGNKKKPIVLTQQILILNQLGMLDKIIELDITNMKKAELLSLILKTDFSNTKKAIEALAKKIGEDDLIKTEHNYNYLSKVFEEFGLPDKLQEVEKRIKKLEAIEKKI